jgi:outer membrane lipase/esterase
MKASNYAVGGARAVAAYPCRVNLPEQVGLYLADFGQTSARAWTAIEIGSNDVRDALQAASEGQSPDAYIAAALSSLGESLATLYASGARKFLLLNVPDIGKTPAVRSLGPAAVAGGGALSAAYNAALAQLVAYWMQLLPGSDMRMLDIHAVLEKIVASPGDFGFVNATEACVTPNAPPFKCARPDTYVFWDGIHPTKAVHALVAKEAVAAITEP